MAAEVGNLEDDNKDTRGNAGAAFYKDGRKRPNWNSSPPTWQTHGMQVAAWPPSGKERKFVLTTWKEELVEHDAAVPGELVRIAPEFAKGSIYSKYAGQVGRLTKAYGDGYWGVLFDGARKEEVFHVGEQGLYMLSYVHARGSKDQFDIKPPPTNDFGKLRTPFGENEKTLDTAPPTRAPTRAGTSA